MREAVLGGGRGGCTNTFYLFIFFMCSGCGGVSGLLKPVLVP